MHNGKIIIIEDKNVVFDHDFSTETFISLSSSFVLGEPNQFILCVMTLISQEIDLQI